uniref:MAP kinase-activating death domain-containing protein n=1 Tax=Timema shepardi TaxID=629360 RepID=A0A7R9AUQ5_TIMSH|nr:unnamed protein product [Timema shepardi]
MLVKWSAIGERLRSTVLVDPKTRQVIQRRYKSLMSDQICYAVLCVFSYIAAGQEQKRQQGGVEPQGATPTRRH